MAKESEIKIDLHNRVKPETLAEIVKMTYRAFHDSGTMNEDAARSDIKSMPIFVWGSPGCGKSSIVRQCAKDLGIDFIDARLPQMEPCDIKGLPVPDKENKVMNWFVNGMWPRGKDTKGILFLDELSACDKSIAVAAYELILDRHLGKLYSIPDGWMIVAAGNLSTDRAVSSTMSSALANRFMHLELEADAATFMAYAVTHNFHPSVVGYIKWRPSHLFSMDRQNLERGWPSPRAWENVSKMCHVCRNEGILRKMVYGLVGNAVGVEFMEYYKMSARFDDVLKYMLDPSLDIEKSYGNLRDLEMSQRYAITSALVYHLWRGSDQKEIGDRIGGFFRIIAKMGSEFATMGCYAAMKGTDMLSSRDACRMLSRSEAYREFLETHYDELKGAETANLEIDIDRGGDKGGRKGK